MWYIYTMEYYSAIKKDDIMPFAATWMELENLILSEMSQKDKDKYHIFFLTSKLLQNVPRFKPLTFHFSPDLLLNNKSIYSTAYFSSLLDI
uniref:DUF1725 domain-containing protein n=1 Tax=Sus scrofa TaxID=9823 RepID=A0A8W4FFZ5_PIG